MQKSQILILNNLVFRTAQKQKMKQYLSMMNYSKFLEKEYSIFADLCDSIRRKYKTEKKEDKDQQGKKIEYYTIPLDKIEDCNTDLKKVSDVLFGDNPKDEKAQNGKTLFLSYLGQMDIKELTGETIEVKEGKEVPVKNYDYKDQILLSEILDNK